MKHLLQSIACLSLLGAMAFAIVGCGDSQPAPAAARQRDPNAPKIKPPGAPPLNAADGTDDPNYQPK